MNMGFFLSKFSIVSLASIRKVPYSTVLFNYKRLEDFYAPKK